MVQNQTGDNGDFTKPQILGNLIDYADGSVVSRTLVKNNAGTITLFSFAQGQGLSEHSAPFDAFVEILDGEAEIKIGDKKVKAAKGDFVIMPANIPHALQSISPFKMLLVMIKG
jgi:quercetin dioxygenase-like cupin family protein